MPRPFQEDTMKRLALVSLALLSLLITGNTMAASTLGGRLVLDDEGSFFVNGRKIQSEHPGASLVVGGDVAANQPLREALLAVAASHGREMSIPPLAWCTDNAAMIGAAAHAALREGRATLHDPGAGLRVDPTWTFGSPVPR